MVSDRPTYYEPDGGRFVPTGYCRGPWSYEHQHGGPPAALMVGLMEGWGEDASQWVIVRITNELFRPLPLKPCEVRVLPDRLNRRVQRLTATLEVDGETIMLMRALRMRRAALELPAVVPAAVPLPVRPEACPPFALDFFPWDEGYHRSFEGRHIEGTWGRGPLSLWTRLGVDVLPGQRPTPWQRVLTIADAESGIAPPLDPRRYWFLNPDLTVLLDREPEGEWIGIAAEARAHAVGTGVAEARIFDVRGTTGRSAQSLLVELAPGRESPVKTGPSAAR